MKENEKIIKAAGIIGLATLFSRVLGFVRDMVVAKIFGATGVADAFYVAFRIPNLLRELFAEGSMSAAFIPVFTEYLTKGSKEEAQRLSNAAFNTLLLILTVVTTSGILVTPWIVRFIAPGFVDDPDKFGLTVLLTKVMFPYLLFIGLASLSMGILNSLRSFAAPALSPAILNICIIAATIFLSARLKEPILGVSIGVLIGGICQFLFQLPSLKKQNMLFRFGISFNHPGIKRIGSLMFPLMIALSVSQINILVNTLLASYLSEGSVSYLYYGMRLIHFPLGLFGIALATAVLPTLSSQFVNKEYNKLKETFSFGLRLVFFLSFPAMVGLIFLRIPIVNLFFQRGEFTYQATLGTSEAVLYYSLGLWAFAGVRIVVPAFYSLQDTGTPMKIAVVSMLLNIILNLLLLNPLGHRGLALATSLSSIFNLIVLIWILRQKLGRIDGRRIFSSLKRIIFSLAVIVVICWVVGNVNLWSLEGHILEKSVLIVGAIFFSIIGYSLCHYFLKSEELFFLLSLIKKHG